MAVYTACLSAAFFVMLAHDQPFIGRLSVGAQPTEKILQHNQCAGSQCRAKRRESPSRPSHSK
ncbi:MAG TPA: hypothetical protein VHT52_25095 [Stellaceae bacterium]|nr:hypothetical protein [Stellaceae bacterium]